MLFKKKHEKSEIFYFGYFSIRFAHFLSDAPFFAGYKFFAIGFYIFWSEAEKKWTFHSIDKKHASMSVDIKLGFVWSSSTHHKNLNRIDNYSRIICIYFKISTMHFIRNFLLSTHTRINRNSMEQQKNRVFH